MYFSAWWCFESCADYNIKCLLCLKVIYTPVFAWQILLYDPSNLFYPKDADGRFPVKPKYTFTRLQTTLLQLMNVKRVSRNLIHAKESTLTLSVVFLNPPKIKARPRFIFLLHSYVADKSSANLPKKTHVSSWSSSNARDNACVSRTSEHNHSVLDLSATLPQAPYPATSIQLPCGLLAAVLTRQKTKLLWQKLLHKQSYRLF